MPSVLFVCTANQFRSPIAAACLLKSIERQNTNAKWIVESAGTWTTSGLPAPRMTLQAANQLGLKGLDRHRTRQVDQQILNQFDLILVMEIGHKEAISVEFPSTHGRIYTLSEIVDDISYDIPDPANFEVNPNDVGRQLSILITRGKGKILETAESLARLRSQR